MAPKCRKAFSTENRNSSRVTGRMNVEIKFKYVNSTRHDNKNLEYKNIDLGKHLTIFVGCVFVGCAFVGCAFVGCAFVGWAFVGCAFVPALLFPAPIFICFRANTVTYFYNTIFNNAC